MTKQYVFGSAKFSAVILSLVLILLGSTNASAQVSIERPDQVAQNLKQLQVVLDDAGALQEKFVKEIEAYKKDVENLKRRYKALPPNTEQRALVAEKIESEQSKALRATYSYLKTVLSSRDKVVKLLEQTVPLIQQDDRKNKYLAEKIAAAERLIVATELEAKRVAVILLYMDADPREQQKLSEQLAYIQDQKLRVQQDYKRWLENIRGQQWTSAQSLLGLKNTLENSLAVIKQRSGSLDLKLDQIFVLANIRRDYAQTRLALGEVRNAMALLKTHFEGFQKIGRTISDLLSPDNISLEAFQEDVDFEEMKIPLDSDELTDPNLERSGVGVSDGKARASKILNRVKSGSKQ